MPKQDSDHSTQLGLEIPTASSQPKGADKKPRSWKLNRPGFTGDSIL